jgi:glycosyltransferase involved in cell wall biosynthesis
VSALRLVRALVDAGTSVAVVAPAGPEITRAAGERDGASVVHIGLHDRFSLARSLRPWRLRAVTAIAELEPDLVHGQGVLTGGLAACDVRAVPRVVTAHGNVREDTLADYRGLGGRVRAGRRARLALDVVRRADWIVGVHPDWRVNLPCEPPRFTHIPNIVETCFFETTAEAEPGRVIYCGGPAPIKGFDVLIAAWAAVRDAVPGAHLRAVGWGAETLRAVAAADGVTLLPSMPSGAIAAEMARAAVLVIPSRYEVAPNLLGEAWAVGVPVVATTAGGLAGLAAGAALLVPPEQPARLASAIVRVLEGDEEARLAVAEGRRRARRRTAAAVANGHRALYRQLVTGNA